MYSNLHCDHIAGCRLKCESDLRTCKSTAGIRVLVYSIFMMGQLIDVYDNAN